MSDEGPTQDEIAAHRDEGHRALGRYIAAFSEMVREMREQMVRRLRKPSDPPLLSAVVFSGATAEPITNAFFSMCRMLKEHDKDEDAAATKLRVLVLEEIKLRNAVAHGDWFIGYWSRTGMPEDEPDRVEPAAPWVYRINAGRKAGPGQDMYEDLDARSDGVQVLTKLLREYGFVCFGVHGRQLAGQSIRVSDVLVLDGNVVRLGPLAVGNSD